MMAIFYVMLIRPQQRREKQRRMMISNIKKGDRVAFSGGILGVVTNVKDKSFMIKVADNVKIEVSRAAVSQVLEKGEHPEEDKK
jgi:preprotein translocase subunit YajC